MHDCLPVKCMACTFYLGRVFFQKADKWAKMLSQEDNLVMLTEFLEKGDSLVLVIYVNQQGQLTPINDFPNTSKNKVCQASHWNEI